MSKVKKKQADSLLLSHSESSEWALNAVTNFLRREGSATDMLKRRPSEDGGRDQKDEATSLHRDYCQNKYPKP